MQKATETFKVFLQGKGLKLTRQREVLVERALELDRHFSAEELSTQMRGEAPRISKATTYRTLSLLVEAGLLEILDVEPGRRLYERAAQETHHDHLICISCKQISEFFDPGIEELQREIVKRFDFELLSHTHQLYGVCSRCRRTKG